MSAPTEIGGDVIPLFGQPILRLIRASQLKFNELSAAIAPEATEETAKFVADEAAKREIIARLITSFVGILASFGLTYFGVKWLSNTLDPTKKEKDLAHKKVKYFNAIEMLII